MWLDRLCGRRRRYEANSWESGSVYVKQKRGPALEESLRPTFQDCLTILQGLLSRGRWVVEEQLDVFHVVLPHAGEVVESRRALGRERRQGSDGGHEV